MIDVGQASTDVLGVARSGGRACAVVLKVRWRRVVSRDVRWLKGAQDRDEAAVARAGIPT